MADTTDSILASVGRQGWRVVGRTQETKETQGTDDAGNPTKTSQPTGNIIWTIAGPNGQTDQMVVSYAPATGQDQGGDTITIVKPPERNPVAPAPVGAPNVVSAPPNEQNIMVRDPTTGALTAIPNANYVAPKDPKATIALGNKVYERQADGTYTVVLQGDKAPHVVAGTSANDQFLIVEDANGNRSQLPNPNYVAPKPSVISGTNTSEPFIVRQNPDGTTSQEPNPNYVAPKPSVVSTNTDAQNIVTLDADGTLHTQPNPNYRAPQASVVPGFAGGDQLPVMKPDANGNMTLTWVPNNGRVMVDAAIFNQFFPALKGLVGDGKGQVPLDVAKDWAQQAYNVVQQQQQGQRDQDTYVSNQTKTAADYASNLYKDIAPPGLSEDTAAIGQALQNHTPVGPMPVRTMNVPDPSSFMASAVAQALADRSPAAQQHLAGQVPFQGPQPQQGQQPPMSLPTNGYRMDDPPLPSYAGGGMVPGPLGRPQLAVVHGGESIYDPRTAMNGATNPGGHTFVFNFGQGQPPMPAFRGPSTIAQGASSYVGGGLPPGLAMLQAQGRLPVGAQAALAPGATDFRPVQPIGGTGGFAPAPVGVATPGGGGTGAPVQGRTGGAPMPTFRGPGGGQGDDSGTAEV